MIIFMILVIKYYVLTIAWTNESIGICKMMRFLSNDLQLASAMKTNLWRNFIGDEKFNYNNNNWSLQKGGQLGSQQFVVNIDELCEL